MTVNGTDTASIGAAACALAVDEWIRAGLTDAVIAPGSRSTPMALALTDRAEMRIHVHHDERSAAFTALGLGLSSGRPAIVLCTSGTAAAEMHPAVVEADLAGVPMLVATADRPPELQGVGAPQTIDQTHIYGRSVRWFAEPGPPAAAALGSWRSLASRAVIEAAGTVGPPGPVHLNLAFREPLVGKVPPLPPGRPGGVPWHRASEVSTSIRSDGAEAIAALLRGRDGVIVAGAGAAGAATSVHDLARSLGWPIVADARAGIGAGPAVVRHADTILRSPEVAGGLRPDAILRIGTPPSSRVVNTWLAGLDDAVEVVVHDGPGRSDPAGAADLTVHADPAVVIPEVTASIGDPAGGGSVAVWQAAEAAASHVVDDVLATPGAPTEPGTARMVARLAGPEDTIVVSSSMPFRDLEWFGGQIGARVLSNRGANGIDGVISTAVGVALDASLEGRGSRTVAVIGDVAFLHDSNALIGLARREVDLTIVIVDNDGGGIFSHLPQATELPHPRFEQLFGTPHGADLSGIAAAHGVPTAEPADADELEAVIEAALRRGGSSAIRVSTDRQAAVDLHRRLHAEVARAVAEVVGNRA